MKNPFKGHSLFSFTNYDRALKLRGAWPWEGATGMG